MSIADYISFTMNEIEVHQVLGEVEGMNDEPDDVLHNEEFSVASLETKEIDAIHDECTYVKYMTTITKIHVQQPNIVADAYKK